MGHLRIKVLPQLRLLPYPKAAGLGVRFGRPEFTLRGSARAKLCFADVTVRARYFKDVIPLSPVGS